MDLLKCWGKFYHVLFQKFNPCKNVRTLTFFLTERPEMIDFLYLLDDIRHTKFVR
jgi:hypothetical protein